MDIQNSTLNDPAAFAPPPPRKEARRIVWVPGEQVLTLKVVVPGRHWRQALAYAVEPHLAQPLEHQEIIPLSRHRTSGETVCAVVDKRLLAQWQAALEQAGWADALMLPDYFRIPEGAHWQMVCHAERCCVRVAQAMGFCAPQAVVHALAQQAGARVVQADEKLADVAGLLRYGLNKGQGAHQSLQTIWRQWRTAAVVLVAILAVWMGQLAWETHRLNQQADAYKKQTLALFKQIFPEVKRVVNIRAQLQGRLQQYQKHTAHTWAELLAAVQKVGAKVKAFKWQAGRGQLTVEAKTPFELDRLSKDVPALTLKQKRKTKTGQWEGVYAIGA